MQDTEFHLLGNIELSKLAALCYLCFTLAGLHVQVWAIEGKTDADLNN